MNRPPSYTLAHRFGSPAWKLVCLALLVALAACVLTHQATLAQSAENPSPTPTSLLERTPIPLPDEPVEEPRLPIGVSSVIGAILLALAYWMNKRGSLKKGQP